MSHISYSYALICLAWLYIIQGIPYGLQEKFVPMQLRVHGLTYSRWVPVLYSSLGMSSFSVYLTRVLFSLWRNIRWSFHSSNDYISKMSSFTSGLLLMISSVLNSRCCGQGPNTFCCNLIVVCAEKCLLDIIASLTTLQCCSVGVMKLVLIPWISKGLFAPVLELAGNRGRWLLGTHIVMALTTLAGEACVR